MSSAAPVRPLVGAEKRRRPQRCPISSKSDWVEEDDGLMASLVPLRGELANWDLRPLYLAWLGRAPAGELDREDLEPPPPPGLGSLTAAQEALVDFLRLDRDLLQAAAAGSPTRLAANEGPRAAQVGPCPARVEEV